MPTRYKHDCGKVLRIPNETAGKRLRCPQCKRAFQAPAATVNGAPTATEPRPAGTPASGGAPRPKVLEAKCLKCGRGVRFREDRPAKRGRCAYCGGTLGAPAPVSPRSGDARRAGRTQGGRRFLRDAATRMRTLPTIEELVSRTTIRAIAAGVILLVIFVLPLGSATHRIGDYGFTTVTVHAWDAAADVVKGIDRDMMLVLVVLLFLLYPAVGGALMWVALRVRASVRVRSFLFFLATALGALGVLGIAAMGVRIAATFLGRSGFGAMVVFLLYVFAFIWANSVARLRLEIVHERVPKITAGVAGGILTLFSFIPFADASVVGTAIEGLKHDVGSLLLLVPLIVGILSSIACFADQVTAGVLNVIILLLSALLASLMYVLPIANGANISVTTAVLGRVFVPLYMLYWGVYFLQRTHYLTRQGESDAAARPAREQV